MAIRTHASPLNAMNFIPFLTGALVLSGIVTASAATAEPPMRVPGKPARAAKAAAAYQMLESALFPAGSAMHLRLVPLAAVERTQPGEAADEKRTRLGVRR